MKYCKACFKQIGLWERYKLWLEKPYINTNLCELCNWDYTKYKGSKESKEIQQTKHVREEHRSDMFKKWLKNQSEADHDKR